MGDISPFISTISGIWDKIKSNPFAIPVPEVMNILEKSFYAVGAEPALKPIKFNDETDQVMIFGDIHGKFNPIASVIEQQFFSDPRNKHIVFLGDYVDRGSQSFETLFGLLLLKLLFPTQVTLLRGNHECMSQGFRMEGYPHTIVHQIAIATGVYDKTMKNPPISHKEAAALLGGMFSCCLAMPVAASLSQFHETPSAKDPNNILASKNPDVSIFLCHGGIPSICSDLLGLSPSYSHKDREERIKDMAHYVASNEAVQYANGLSQARKEKEEYLKKQDEADAKVGGGDRNREVTDDKDKSMDSASETEVVEELPSEAFERVYNEEKDKKFKLFSRAINELSCLIHEKAPPIVSQSSYSGLMWNDPTDATSLGDLSNPQKYTKIDLEKEATGMLLMPSPRGDGCHLFTKSMTRRFNEAYSMSGIIRAHQAIPSGFGVHHGGDVATVFSSPAYRAPSDVASYLIASPSERGILVDVKRFGNGGMDVNDKSGDISRIIFTPDLCDNIVEIK
ncbi:hypothetical protein ADUPG1_007761 [Aduncisulcus paluster]|uniref:Serine/threonine-protein phosphatase n=1 Tax=Aduncisulcus paluster TaxID=2918883 RepID=A0ABQ5KPF5_9EUKA|nr:hypothetical protein ADUPG1_007761 [Aduncisulcus paluster]|eukprot:gnl/Carplike_NY0171/6374_a8762_178.p1 GENE.gnl/Carplike_NY0171/6374_a8762_178~~gnl/Carplike_NY0171/6374_a8762_178.p1  ORF type:complete len:508 (-),score=112.56 gnl/Carplike_NY0171/6374_a8762_178:17-1540(-)